MVDFGFPGRDVWACTWLQTLRRCILPPSSGSTCHRNSKETVDILTSNFRKEICIILVRFLNRLEE
jgi:hypothetical protein